MPTLDDALATIAAPLLGAAAAVVAGCVPPGQPFRDVEHDTAWSQISVSGSLHFSYEVRDAVVVVDDDVWQSAGFWSLVRARTAWLPSPDGAVADGKAVEDALRSTVPPRATAYRIMPLGFLSWLGCPRKDQCGDHGRRRNNHQPR